MRLAAIRDAVAGLDGVDFATVWTRVAGKERVYVDLENHNGRDASAGRRCWITADGSVHLDGQWTGARTRRAHEDSGGTLDRIRAAVAALPADEPTTGKPTTTESDLIDRAETALVALAERRGLSVAEIAERTRQSLRSANSDAATIGRQLIGEPMTTEQISAAADRLA